jgi:hypothetical protein
MTLIIFRLGQFSLYYSSVFRTLNSSSVLYHKLGASKQFSNSKSTDSGATMADDQGPTQQNFISAENFSPNFLSSNFG